MLAKLFDLQIPSEIFGIICLSLTTAVCLLQYGVVLWPGAEGLGRFAAIWYIGKFSFICGGIIFSLVMSRISLLMADLHFNQDLERYTGLLLITFGAVGFLQPYYPTPILFNVPMPVYFVLLMNGCYLSRCAVKRAEHERQTENKLAELRRNRQEKGLYLREFSPR